MRRSLSSCVTHTLQLRNWYPKEEYAHAGARLEKAKEHFEVAKREYDQLADDTLHNEKAHALAEKVGETQRRHDELSRELSTLSRELGRIEGVIDLAKQRQAHERARNYSYFARGAPRPRVTHQGVI